MISEELEGFAMDRVITAYLAMLTIPYDSVVRLKSQGIMCELRDLLAELRDVSPESVQNDFEEAIANGVVIQ